jgi:plasmid stabilization system protein ParE
VAKIVWSDHAVSRLHQIFEFYVLNFDRDVAIKVVNTIEEAVTDLASFPEMGAIEPVSQAAGVGLFRYLIIRHHKAVYTFFPEFDTVLIATVFDARQDPDSLVAELR